MLLLPVVLLVGLGLVDLVLGRRAPR